MTVFGPSYFCQYQDNRCWCQISDIADIKILVDAHLWIGRRLVQLFHHPYTEEFFPCLWNVEIETLAVFPLYLEFLLLLLETMKSNTVNEKKLKIKQIPIGQRCLGCWLGLTGVKKRSMHAVEHHNDLFSWKKELCTWDKIYNVKKECIIYYMVLLYNYSFC